MNEENSRYKMALEKIANSTCHEAQCWPLHKIARDALLLPNVDIIDADATAWDATKHGTGPLSGDY